MTVFMTLSLRLLFLHKISRVWFVNEFVKVSFVSVPANDIGAMSSKDNIKLGIMDLNFIVRPRTFSLSCVIKISYFVAVEGLRISAS